MPHCKTNTLTSSQRGKACPTEILPSQPLQHTQPLRNLTLSNADEWITMNILCCPIKPLVPFKCYSDIGHTAVSVLPSALRLPYGSLNFA
jgi:hypothetical protein